MKNITQEVFIKQKHAQGQAYEFDMGEGNIFIDDSYTETFQGTQAYLKEKVSELIKERLKRLN